MPYNDYHKAGEVQRNLQVGRGTLSAFLRSLGTTRCSSQGFIGLQHWRPAPLPLPAPASNQSSTVKARRFRSASFCLKPGLETALQRLALGVRGLAGADTEWAPRPSAALQASGTARFQSTGARARRQGRLGALLGAASLKDRSTARVKQRARRVSVRIGAKFRGGAENQADWGSQIGRKLCGAELRAAPRSLRES